MAEEAAADIGGHLINGKIYTTEQLQEKIKRNLLYDKFVYNPKWFWRMFAISMVNFILSPVLGLSLMLEFFGSQYVKNKFIHNYHKVTILIIPTLTFFSFVIILSSDLD